MSGEKAQPIPPVRNPPPCPDARRQLTEWVERNTRELRGILRAKVAPLCREMLDPGEVADELLSELVLELYRSAERYDPARSPKFWAMAFAGNIARRWQERKQRECPGIPHPYTNSKNEGSGHRGGG